MLDVDPELILSAGDEVSWLVFTFYMTTSTLNHTHEHTETQTFISASQIFMHMKLTKQVSCCFATLYKRGTKKLINCVSQTACLLLLQEITARNHKVS